MKQELNPQELLNAQTALFFNNVDTIIVPKKVEYNLNKYVSKKLLKAIDADENVAIDKCLLFTSLLSSTYFNEDTKWKRLHSTILRNIFGDYKSIIECLSIGTSKGSIIEVDLDYKITEFARSYRLTDGYLKAGLTTAKLTTNTIISKRRQEFFKQLKNGYDNVIFRNLIEVYSMIELPTEKEIKEEGKRLVKENYNTKKSKKLTMRNKHTNDYWNDYSERVFVEDNIKIFNYLTDLNYLIPVIGDSKSGGRVVDSFNLMPSWIRNLVKIDNEEIVQVDFKALHPNIAISIFGGDEKYITHNKIAQKSGVSADIVKDEHLSFFNKPLNNTRINGKFIPGMKSSPLFDYYQQHEPTMLQNIINDKKTNGYKNTFSVMATKETEIMTEAISRLNEQGIFVIYVYDALYSKKSEAKKVAEVMNEVIAELGVYTMVELDDLSTPNEVKEEVEVVAPEVKKVTLVDELLEFVDICQKEFKIQAGPIYVIKDKIRKGIFLTDEEIGDEFIKHLNLNK